MKICGRMPGIRPQILYTGSLSYSDKSHERPNILHPNCSSKTGTLPELYRFISVFQYAVFVFLNISSSLTTVRH